MRRRLHRNIHRETPVRIPGWRDSLLVSLVEEGRRLCRQLGQIREESGRLSSRGTISDRIDEAEWKGAFDGYMNCLYTLRASMSPPAVIRDRDTEEFQRVIHLAIADIKGELEDED